MSGCYHKGLRCLAMEVAKDLDVAAIMQEGVYAMVGGPNFESIAEARLLHRVGVDAVGKSKHRRSLLRSSEIYKREHLTEEQKQTQRLPSYASCDCRHIMCFLCCVLQV